MTTDTERNDPAEPRRRADGEQTHAAILDAAMRLASVEGLGSLTIGRLAQELDVSKSGVFAHFRSKERLQRETIAAAGEVFEREVIAPGMAAPEGLARLEALCEAYLSYVERGVFPGGCFFQHVLAEYDARSGAIYEEVLAGDRLWTDLLASQVALAQEAGDLDPAVDPEQLVFELYAALELANSLATLRRDPSLVERGRAAVRAAIERAALRRDG